VSEHVNLTIDGVPVEAAKGELVIDVAERDRKSVV